MIDLTLREVAAIVGGTLHDVPDPEAGKGIQLNGDIPQDVMNKCFSQIGNK